MADQSFTIPGQLPTLNAVLAATITHLEQRIRSMAAAADGLRRAFNPQ
tara:strand:- start:1036 stop:1179 length:144 start_codon:yes stop_codon:yes gene_type:complete